MSSVLEVAEAAAREAGGLKITKITLSIGRFSEVHPDAMEFAHEALIPGTLAEGSELVINMVEAHSRCHECAHEFTHDRFSRACPSCGSWALELLSGRELSIESVEVEDED